MKDQLPDKMNRKETGILSVYAEIKQDYCRYTNRSVSFARCFSKVISHPGFRAVVLYRLARWFRKNKRVHFAGLMQRLIFYTCFCEIKSSAEIAPGFLISHTIGLVIGGGTHIGRNCDVRQNTTFGGNFNKVDKNGRSHPWLEDNVSVGAGAIIIGPVKIGANSIIGANSVVTKNIPENVIVSGISAQVIKERWPVDAQRKL